jgi:hypothetical protein
MLSDSGDLNLSRSSPTRVCVGCFFVAFKGRVVTLINPAIEGGLVDPEMIVREDDVLVVSSIGYHTTSVGASGTIRCTK